MTRRSALHPALALLTVFALAAAAGAQTIDPTNEGYDPMRQISSQFVRPNILLVFDVSGSMAWDEINNHTVGTDQTGTWLTAWWSRDGDDCYNSKCREYEATLTVRQTHPSRMATVKNALGNSMNIITPWSPPGGACSDPARQWPALAWTGGSITGPTVTLNNTSNSYWEYKFTWTISYLLRQSDPGNPFVTTGLTAQPPTIGCDCEYRPASDLIGKTRDKVNWGLEIFSGVASSCTAATLVVPPDSRDLGDVRGLEICMRANNAGASYVDGVPYQGLFASGGTPSKAAMGFAVNIMRAVAGGGSVTNYNNSLYYSTFPSYYDAKSWSITADAKLECGRVYATILVTDGLSNTCNPSDGGNWAEPCLSCPGAGCPDGGSSGYTCPNPYPTTKMLQLPQSDAFLAEKADALWWLAVGGRRIKARTWVIGVSDAVGPCELNYTAYRGRTDASAPEGDTGFDTEADPYLPESNSTAANAGNYDAPTCPSHNPPHGNYAFFPKTAAQLEAAFAEILGAIGTGDYTTSAPTVTSSSTSAEGLIGFVSSASYPKWKGHVYAYDLTANCADTTNWNCLMPCGWVDPSNPARKSNCLWDAGEVLSIGGLNPDGSRKSPNNGLARKLYTWDPAGSYANVEITAANVTALNALCGGCGITAQVVDFMRGNDGNLDDADETGRPWKLGGVINSTQAVIGPPVIWKQNKTEEHSGFETTYEDRHQIVWAGSSDGFVHGFDAVDGAELVGFIPPELLARQVELYENYVSKPTQLITGQPKLPDDHLYGMANSPRFADIWFPADNEYKTVLVVTAGPGGQAVAAIDVTHPFPGRDYNGDGDTLEYNEGADANYGYGVAVDANPEPARALWSKNRGDLPQLGNSWSVPALGAVSKSEWELLIGGGFDPALTTSDSPVAYRLDPVDGALISTELFSNQNTGAYVRNQAFADAVLWQTGAPFFQQDNLVNQGVQGDLQGRLWGLQPSNWNPSALFNVLATQPLYYSPAVAAYPATASPTHRLYAFASGSFYERSPNVTGRGSTFVPKLYIGTKTPNGASQLASIALTSIPKPYPQSGFLGSRTQVTAPPALFVAKPGSEADPFALFLVYDPDAGVCVGTSYIIRVGFDPNALTSIFVPATQVYSAGSGASAGFALAGRQVVVSHSYVGEGGRASLVAVPDLDIPPGDLSGSLSWWLELQ